MSVELGGLRGQCGARVVDISLGGALLVMSQSALDLIKLPDEDAFQVVAREFAEGFDVSFLDAAVAIEAVPVRLCIPPGEQDLLYLGCRFAEDLSDTLRAKLGLPSPKGA